MVAAYVSASHQTYDGGSSTTAVLPSPSGATAGDLAVVILHIESGIKTITKPSGWTEEAQLASGTTTGMYLLWKYLTGSEVAADRTFSWTGGAWRSADMFLIRGGVTSGNPFGGTIGETTATSGTSRASVNYTTSGAGLGFWIHHTFADNSTITLPSGYTSRVSQDDHCFELATRSDTAGSKSTGTATGPNAAYVLFAGTFLDTAASTDGDVTAVAAEATAAAEIPAVAASAAVTGEVATATAAALEPTAIGGATVTGVAATATAAAPAPTVVAGALVTAVTATASSLALPPAVTVDATVAAEPATATAAVLPPVVDPGETPNGSVAAEPATATAAALPPAATGGAQVAAVAATSTAQALPPTVGVSVSVAGVPAVAVANSQLDASYHSPLSITVGGTYTGTVVNLTPGEVAIEILTTDPVTLVDMDIYSIGAGIEAPITGTQLTVQNCHFEALTPDITIREQQCIRAWEPHTLIFENNSSENCHGVQVSGAGTYVSTTIRIDKNFFRNIGRLSQPLNYQGAVHLDNVQCPGMKVRWNEVFNQRGLSHSEDTIACSNGTSGALGNEIEVAYNLINGTYPISGDGTSFTGGAYDFGDIAGGYIEAHHNYAINYTNNGFMIPSGHDIIIRDCVAVYDGLDDQGVQCSTSYGWGFTVANLYGGGESPNTYLQDNRAAHLRWDGFWDTANYQWNAANLGDQDLGGNVSLGTATPTLEQDAIDEWEALVADNGITIGAVPRVRLGAPEVTGTALVTAVAATAAAEVLLPEVAGAGDQTIEAVPATATAQVLAPTVGTDASVVAVVAEATAEAAIPVATGAATVIHWQAWAFAQPLPPDVFGEQSPTVLATVATARCRVFKPVVQAPAPLYRFEPPTHEETIQSEVGALNRFTLTHAKTIYRTDEGTFAARRLPAPRLITGVEGVDYFLGGRVYEVSPEVAAELTAAGYSPVFIG